VPAVDRQRLAVDACREVERLRPCAAAAVHSSRLTRIANISTAAAAAARAVHYLERPRVRNRFPNPPQPAVVTSQRSAVPASLLSPSGTCGSSQPSASSRRAGRSPARARAAGCAPEVAHRRLPSGLSWAPTRAAPWLPAPRPLHFGFPRRFVALPPSIRGRFCPAEPTRQPAAHPHCCSAHGVPCTAANPETHSHSPCASPGQQHDVVGGAPSLPNPCRNRTASGTVYSSNGSALRAATSGSLHGKVLATADRSASPGRSILPETPGPQPPPAVPAGTAGAGSGCSVRAGRGSPLPLE
jgi:hypothetical protein